MILLCCTPWFPGREKKLFNFVEKLIYDDPVKPAGLRAVLLQAPSPKNNMTYETNNKTMWLLHAVRATVLSRRRLFVTRLATYCLLFAFILLTHTMNHDIHLYNIRYMYYARAVYTYLLQDLYRLFCTVIQAAPHAVAFSKDTWPLHYRPVTSLVHYRVGNKKIRVDVYRKMRAYRKRRAVGSGLLYYITVWTTHAYNTSSCLCIL